jgi:hypothetical protein
MGNDFNQQICKISDGGFHRGFEQENVFWLVTFSFKNKARLG